MLTRIVEYSDVHRSGCEPFLNELQSYLISIDEENVQIMPSQYTSWNFPQMHMLFRMMNGKTEDIAYFIILITLTAKILQQLFCDLLTNQRSTVV